MAIGCSAVTSPTAERPVLFLDVDGPLIPFGPSSGRRRAFAHDADASASASASAEQGNPLLGRLDPALGPRLLALREQGCELVWASTWLDEANETVAPRIGLPRLPVVRWPEEFTDAGPRGLHWKTRPLLEWAGPRPFIWVDDEIGAMDRFWVAAEHPASALLHRVAPDEGLTDGDFAVLAEWLRVGRAGSWGA